MIKDIRYQVSALSINGGERVTGFLKQIPNDGNVEEKRSIIEWYTSDDIGKVYHHFCTVDAATIKPIKCKPERYSHSKTSDMWMCPSCGFTIHHGKKNSYGYCYHCGMAIDWDE